MPLIGLAIPSALVGLVNIPGVEWPAIQNFTTWLGVRVVGMGDHHAEGIEITLAIIGSVAAILGVVVGWLIWGRDRDTQQARDWFHVPVLYPLLQRKYYLDDVAMGVVAGPWVRSPVSSIGSTLCARRDRQCRRWCNEVHRRIGLQRSRPAGGRRCGQRFVGGGRQRRVGLRKLQTGRGAAVRILLRSRGPGARRRFRVRDLEERLKQWNGSRPGA